MFIDSAMYMPNYLQYLQSLNSMDVFFKCLAIWNLFWSLLLTQFEVKFDWFIPSLDIYVKYSMIIYLKISQEQLCVMVLCANLLDLHIRYVELGHVSCLVLVLFCHWPLGVMFQCFMLPSHLLGIGPHT